MHEIAVDPSLPIVVLTGAGISRESGLHTFRDADGIWATVRIEDVATPDAFARNPARVHAFYNSRRTGLQDPSIEPNAAHFALARLEAAWPGGVTLVTQNIDNLHERAGSRSLIHMHGELLKSQCNGCGAVMPWLDDLSTETACPSCGRQGSLRPNVVWFGEMPLAMDLIGERLSQCGLFISIGTSGTVYPAAGFVAEIAARRGAQSIELNLEPSEGASLFDYAIHGPATAVVPEFVDHLLNGVEPANA